MSEALHTKPRIFVKGGLAEGERLALDAAQTHYLAHVLRSRQGELVRVFNGKDGEWLARLETMPKGKKDAAKLLVERRHLEQRQEPDLWLCAAPIKQAHFDFLVMKAVELGVSVIQPVLTARTQVRKINPERLFSIAVEAAEQSERLTVPDINAPRKLEALLENWPSDRLIVLCAEFGQAEPIAQAALRTRTKAYRSAAFFTGPEGGFSRDEMEALRTKELTLPVSLGPRILRADTAALAALSCWQALRGDWADEERGTHEAERR